MFRKTNFANQLLPILGRSGGAFSHNLRIALRNLAKYKLQTAITVLSMAIGIVVLAAVHSFITTNLRPPQITTTPHFERACRLSLDSLHRENMAAVSRPIFASLDVLRAIRNEGEIYGVELGPTFPNGQWNQARCEFTLRDTLERTVRTQLTLIDPLYPNYAGYVSAITGEPIAPLRNGEAILSAYTAKNVFGNENPVGASLKGSYFGIDQSLTVTDVYEDLAMYDTPVTSGAILFARNNEDIMADKRYETQAVAYIDFVLKPGCTPEQLAEEVNRRIAPFGLKVKARWVKDVLADEIQVIATARTVMYLLGSLILLAAIVGFLRMQLQLFWMRKRELSLRIVNGAKRRQLFALLMTEVVVVVLLAVGLAMCFGSWLEEFLNVLFANLLQGNAFTILQNVVPVCAAVGGVLLAICGVMVWITLGRIIKSADGLAAGMRGARSHGFRNTMLWLQVAVGMFFVSTALIMTNFCNVVVNQQVLPDDIKPYRNATMVNTYGAHRPDLMCQAVSELPEVAQAIPFDDSFYLFEEISRRDSLWRPRWGAAYLKALTVKDTLAFDFFDVEPTWTRPELAKNNTCILIHKEMYDLLESEGILANGILTMSSQSGGLPIPVVGTFKDIAFNYKIESRRMKFIILRPNGNDLDKCVLLPRDGDNEALRYAVDAAIARVEPTTRDRYAFNFLEEFAPQVILTDNLRMAAWTLGAVALVVCVMSIYSTIALDTRARRKEVAIRKINGAKSGNIAMMFARLYLVLCGISVVLLLPLFAVVEHLMSGGEGAPTESEELNVVWYALVGCLTVIGIIALVVGRQVHTIMRINSVEMIAKE